MSQDITITLSDVEYKALGIIALDPQDWVQNAAKVRAEKAIKAIADEIVAQKRAAGEPITGTDEELVMAADIPSAAEEVAQQEAENEPK